MRLFEKGLGEQEPWPKRVMSGEQARQRAGKKLKSGQLASARPAEIRPRNLDVMRLGMEHHAARRLTEAALEYRRILEGDPQNAEALLLLGIVARQSGQAQAAVKLLSAAVSLAEGAAHIHLNLGHAHRDAGDGAAAVLCYRRAAELSEGFAEAHLSLGDLLARLGHPQEARAAYRRAIQSKPTSGLPYANDGNLYFREGRFEEAVRCFAAAAVRLPGHADVLGNLGLALAKLDRLDEAEAAFRKAIALAPAQSRNHLNLGSVHRRKGELGKALASSRQAVRLDPLCAQAHSNLGNALADTGRFQEAIASYNRALTIKPDDAEVQRSLGDTLLSERDLDAAEACYRKALELQPESIDAQNSFGNLLLHRQKIDEAEEVYRRILARTPGHAEALANLGTAYLRRARPSEALECYLQAVESNPNHAGLHYNLGIACLLAGDYDSGFREYEWRWDFKELRTPRKDFRQPQWQGEPLEGRRILLHAEQGLGDTIQFARYAPLVTARGGEVILQVQPTLKRLLASMDGVAAVVARGESLPEFSMQCPLMSLALAFGTTADTIPAKTPYLRAEPREVVEQGRRCPGKGLRVGLAWAGNPKNRSDARRSMPLEALVPLGAIPGVSLISLQQGSAAGQIAQVAERLDIQNACVLNVEMADTAALVAGLDLIVTVDTSVAHLAGAMGKPVWVMLPFSPDWRWLLDRDDSPWYPSARLFRQASAGDWGSVVEQIARELRALSKSKHGLLEAAAG
jgi:tetratricopeptide (TPR) repeat protein